MISFICLQKRLKKGKDTNDNRIKIYIERFYLNFAESAPLSYLDLAEFISKFPHDDISKYVNILKDLKAITEENVCFILALAIIIKVENSNHYYLSKICSEFKPDLSGKTVNDVLSRINQENSFPFIDDAIRIRDNLTVKVANLNQKNEEIINLQNDNSEFYFSVILILQPYTKDSTIFNKLYTKIKGDKEILKKFRRGIEMYCNCFTEDSIKFTYYLIECKDELNNIFKIE